jgi:hypothetical protein
MEPVKKVLMMYGTNLYSLSVDELVSLINGECQVTDTLKTLVENLKVRVLALQEELVRCDSRKTSLVGRDRQFLVEEGGKKITPVDIYIEDLKSIINLNNRGFKSYQEKALAVIAKQVGKVNMVKWQDKECEEFTELCMKEAIRLMKEDL